MERSPPRARFLRKHAQPQIDLNAKRFTVNQTERHLDFVISRLSAESYCPNLGSQWLITVGKEDIRHSLFRRLSEGAADSVLLCETTD
ncbi:Hypothetical predicted protein [Scomber scombrus]|uniref:Uncharacterized protein n=1 Tax=Scomber scombrus TaxID=13677 RepID=A0AAV1NFX2_SCOSC